MIEQFLDALNHPGQDLSEVLIALPPKVFSAALHHFQNKHLELLKNEKLLEPLQYHLTQFAHEGESLYHDMYEKIEKFEVGLQSIQILGLSSQDLIKLISTIDSFRIELLSFLERTRIALSIGWNTERVDLIEKLSDMNEKLQHLLVNLVGHPSSEKSESTGLFLKLKDTLSSIYDLSLKDEDASVEGLTRLSIWHLKDYWEMGLLPEIPDFKTLDLSAPELFAHVQERLKRLKIGTVAELKRENIFSKDMLKTYIASKLAKM